MTTTNRLVGDNLNQVPRNRDLGEYAYLDTNQFTASLSASAAPAEPGSMVFQLTDNTTLVVKVMGSDGTVRSATLTLA